MSTTTVLGAIASKPSGTVRKYVEACTIYAGNKASNSPITATLNIAMNYHSGLGGAHVKAADTLATIAAGTAYGPTFKPYNAGTFQYYPGGNVRNITTGQVGSHYTIYGYSTFLSGIASTVIKYSAADKGRKTSNARVYNRTLHQSSWNWTTGKAGTATVTKDWAGVVSTDSSDHAAKNPRSVPAEFTLLYTGKTPTNKDYPALTD